MTDRDRPNVPRGYDANELDRAYQEQVDTYAHPQTQPGQPPVDPTTPPFQHDPYASDPRYAHYTQPPFDQQQYQQPIAPDVHVDPYAAQTGSYDPSNPYAQQGHEPAPHNTQPLYAEPPQLRGGVYDTGVQPHTSYDTADGYGYAAPEPGYPADDAAPAFGAQPAQYGDYNQPTLHPPHTADGYPQTGHDDYDLNAYSVTAGQQPLGAEYYDPATNYSGQDPHTQGYEAPATAGGMLGTGPQGYAHAEAGRAVVGSDDPNGDFDRYDDHDGHGDFDDDGPDSNRGATARRLVALAASLVVVVALGGALAFGYRHYMEGASKAGAPSPVIRASTEKSKVAPQNPGGTRFANQDSKLLGRLDRGRGVPNSTSARTRDAADRVRTVSTHVVRPDGTLVTRKAPPRQQPQQIKTAAVSTLNAANRASTLPGMVIDRTPIGQPSQPARAAGEPSPQQLAAQRRAAQQRAARQRAQAEQAARARAEAQRRQALASRSATPNAPVVISRATTAPVQSANPAARATRPASRTGIPLPPRNSYPREQRTAALSTSQPAVRSDAAPVRAAPAQPITRAPTTQPSRGGARGYGVVLASQGSRMEALRTFADLQQRFSGALNNKVPDVQAADLSSRGLGTMYRLVVGPPASRAAANDLCRKLRAAGYESCWVKAY